MTVSAQTRVQVTDIIDRFASSYSRKDFETTSALLNDVFTWFGPGCSSVTEGRETFVDLAKRDLSSGPGCSLAFDNIIIAAEGTTAWVCGTWRFVLGENSVMGYMTAVLRGTGHTWVIAHLHLSAGEGAQVIVPGFNSQER